MNSTKEAKTELLKEYLGIQEQLMITKARISFKHFVARTMENYEWNWHHKHICDKLQQLASGEIKRLMVFMPPRHGKSQLCSRHFPPYILGMNPNHKIIATSYSADLASDMNTDCQKIIDSDRYREIFPDTQLSGRNVVTLTLPKRNSSRFDIVNASGYYISSGVGGAITGKGADFAIIDDPIKNAEEAESKTYRDRVYKWFISTLFTRLEEAGRLLVVMTRWHEDDLAGRLVDKMTDWTIVNFPAIREEEENTEDPREVGQALWPKKYSIESLLNMKDILGSRYFTSLYQQKPSPSEGEIIKRDWFGRYSVQTIPRGSVDFYIDSSYTDNTKNDPTAIFAWFTYNRKMYVINVIAKHMTFPQLIKFLPAYLEAQGYSGRSMIYVEPKASGKSIVQQFKEHTNLNIVEDKTVKEGKLTRVYAAGPTMEAGRVLLPEGEPWVEEFLTECAQFPNGAHDDRVDCLTGAIRMAFRSPGISMTGFSYD